ncbi:MAG: DUF4184 family protein [Acidobacteria bacterium]|nr:DUF4184 family protein [Acidobacteriota bacterium]
MPFTPAHAAAALLFRRTRLVLSAVVIGTLAPDFEYFLRFQPDGRFGHTVLGALCLTLPSALVVLWMFHAILKRPTARLLPDAVQRRLENQLDEFRFGGAGRFFLIVASIVVGISTHIFWDSFTHSGSWWPRHSTFLQQHVPFPLLGRETLFRVLQHLSTIAGLAVVTAWLTVWYRSTLPSTEPLDVAISAKRKALTWAALSSIALLGALGHAFFVIGIPVERDSAKLFLGSAVVTGIALLWWQLVLYGIWSSRKNAPGRLEAMRCGDKVEVR